MQKRGKSLNYNLALSQIFILILAIFSFAFIFGEVNLVSGDIGDIKFNKDVKLKSGKQGTSIIGTKSTVYNIDSSIGATGKYEILVERSAGNEILFSGNIEDITQVVQNSDGTLTLFGKSGELAKIPSDYAPAVLKEMGNYGLTSQETFSLFGTKIATGGVAH